VNVILSEEFCHRNMRAKCVKICYDGLPSTCSREVSVVHSHGSGVVVDGKKALVSRVAETGGDAPASGEEIEVCWHGRVSVTVVVDLPNKSFKLSLRGMVMQDP